MRRSLISISVSIAAAAGCSAVAAASPTSGAGRPGVCPGGSSGPPPCCTTPPQALRGQVIPPCCEPPTPFPCVQGVTIFSSPDPSTAGRVVVVSGHVLGGQGGTAVTLWQRLAGAHTFVPVATTTTDAAGDYKFVRKGTRANTNRDWRASSGSATSLVVSQRVRAHVTLKVSSAAAGAQVRVVLSGTVAPAHPGEKVAVQRLVGAQWVLIVRIALQQGSTFSRSLLMASSGPGRVRVVLSGDRRNVRSSSPPRTTEL